MSKDSFLPRTYFALDADGEFRETVPGPKSYETIVNDIATGEYEVVRVYRARGGKFDDVSSLVCDAVYERLSNRGPGRTAFIPSFLTLHDPEWAERLRQSWLSPEEAKTEREDAAADRARDEQRERMLEAAE